MLYAATEAATLEAPLQAPLPPQEQGQA
jgi:hypothetical protein